MLWTTSLLAALVAATGAHASLASLIAEGMTRDSPSYHRRMEEIAKRSLQLRSMARRQATQPPSADVQLNNDGTIDMTAWDAQVTSACTQALNHLPEASNPSGTCICYNLPALNNKTGTFEADLRLYRISTPTGQFAGIPPQNIQVGLSYRGASVSPVSPQTVSQKVVTPALVPRQNTNGQTIAANATNLQLLQAYFFLGQIDMTQMNDNINMAELEALVMPTVTLSALNTAGVKVATNVSSNEAAFVAGVFSQEIVMSEFSRAQAAVELEIAAMKNGTAAFVLPGVQILIFPVGLVITGLWMILGMAAYAYGTINRIQFADSYKRRAQVVTKSGVSRI